MSMYFFAFWQNRSYNYHPQNRSCDTISFHWTTFFIAVIQSFFSENKTLIKCGAEKTGSFKDYSLQPAQEMALRRIITKRSFFSILLYLRKSNNTNGKLVSNGVFRAPVRKFYRWFEILFCKK